ncbi:MAG: LPS assembly lipoprotein LptE [Bryobacterales bacterium]
MRLTLALLGLSLSFAGCGYHLAGKADTIPDEIHAIAVPAFQNGTTEYKIEQYVTQSIVRELISRTRYQVVNREENADATLQGVVTGFFAFPQNFDPVTNRATTVTTITRVHVTLVDRRTGGILYQNPNLEFRERYEVSADPTVYFEEREAALQRSSEAMARAVVSAVLEGF